jgi:hypothetical protein
MPLRYCTADALSVDPGLQAQPPTVTSHGSPTLSPSGAPSAVPTSSAAPSSGPTQGPSSSPSEAPTVIDCINTAALGGQDSGCPSERPICVLASGGEPPSFNAGASCAPCINSMMSYEVSQSDQGCSTGAAFCVNLDTSEPALTTRGQLCTATSPGP